MVSLNTAPDSMRTWMDDVQCLGTEAALADCDFAGWGNENCGHSEDVILVCTNAEEPGNIYMIYA